MTKYTELDAIAAVAAADLISIIDDVIGTPTSKKATVLEFLEVVDALTELVVSPADTDNILVIDGGVPKRIEFSTLVGDIGGGRARLSLPVTAAHLPDDSAGSAAAQIQKKTSSDANDPQVFWVEALFDDSTDEHIYFQFLMPDNYDSAPVVDVYYKATADTGNTSAFGARIAALSDGDAADMDANAFDAHNGGTSTTPGTAGHLDVVSITMTNDDSVAANDMVILCVYRDESADGAAGDLEVPLVVLRYTST